VSGLLGPNGKPISQYVENKRAPAPLTGERYGRWAGPEMNFMILPGGGTIAFDTSQLTLADFRQMKAHYQINSSLSVLTFMMHQMGWHIECENQKIADLVGNQLTNVWSRLVRAQSQSLWAGFGPNVLDWKNDAVGREVVLDKIKDLIPEDCRVHWKRVQTEVPNPNKPPATITTTHSVYNGIDQIGSPVPIPVDNSYWYPLLMENGNYYGKRILESAFQPWFFSTLMHLFANRYYERYGEPTPIGRAPYDDEIDIAGKSMKGNELMALIIQQLRNRSTVVLPNERTSMSDHETKPQFDYSLEYLESQMRGADFERYLTRLDEEMSLAMFTPLLMMRTADVGSYNLGTQHTQVYQWMLNALGGDWAFYIDQYIISPIINWNFGPNAPRAHIKFSKMGKANTDLLNSILQAGITKGTYKVDVRELGEMTGLTIEEVEVVTNTPAPPPAEQAPNKNQPTKNLINEIAQLIIDRVDTQVRKAYRTGTFGDSEEFSVKMGYKRQLADAMHRNNLSDPGRRVDDLYAVMDEWVETSCSLGPDEFKTPEDYMGFFKNKLERMIEVFTR
jgi:hypothetical protein